MYKIKKELQGALDEIKKSGLYKVERVITSDQKAEIEVTGRKEVINFCANNYLGLANNTEIIGAAKQAMDSHGFGLSSVRFICGTQDLHKELEKKIAEFFQAKMPSSTPRAGMQTAASSRSCSTTEMP